MLEKCHGKTEVWFNPGAPNLIRDSFNKVIRDLVDILILNRDEAKSITNRGEMNEITAELGKVVGLSVITLGRAGCIVVAGKEYKKVPLGNIVDNADNTGAEDTFSAGFMVSKLRGMDNLQSTHLGHNAAANFLKEKGEGA